MIVRYRTYFDDEEREWIAAFWDAHNEVWPMKKRLATHKECRKWIHHARSLHHVFEEDTIYEWEAEHEEVEEE